MNEVGSIWKPVAVQEVPRLALSSEEASKAIGVSKRTLDQMAIEGRIPSFRIGSRRLFGTADLSRWITQETENQTSKEGGKDNA